MNKLLSLIKTDLNITFGLSSILYSLKTKKNRWQIILFSIAILSLLPSYFLFIKGLWTFYDAFMQLGQQSYFLLMGFLASQLMVFFFGVLYVMSKFYFSNDLIHLLPLPIKPSQILTSKFITIMVSEYLTSLPIFLPFVIIYGLKESSGLVYWIYTILTTVVLPVLPLVLASLLLMVFMKYTNIKGKKDLIRIIGSVFFIFGILYVQFQFQRLAMNSIGENFLENLAKDANLLVRKLGIMFPPSMWGALGLANYDSILGLTNIILFIGLSILFFFIMVFLSEKLFLGGLIGNFEVSGKGLKARNINLEKASLVSKPYLALAKKELKMLFKTPIYLINSIGGVIIVPIIIVMSLVTQDESIEPLFDFLNSNFQVVVLGIVGLIGSLGILNSVGTTTFSREGKNFWIQRTLPISTEDQIYGRTLAALMVQLLGIAALLIALFFIIDIDPISVIIIIVLGVLISIPMTLIGMIIDILRPMLTWTNPQQAMKQNLNVLIGMGVGVLYLGGLFFLVRFMLNRVDMYLIYLILVGIMIISSFIFFRILKALIIKQFKEIE